MNKHIKTLIFSSTKNQHDLLQLNFSPGVNIIIGPKGGGKSTLLEIIYWLHNGIQPKSLILDTLRRFNLKIEKIIYSDEFEREWKNCDKYIEKDANNREDLITQNDQIKTKLNENERIVKDRREFVEEIVKEQTTSFCQLFNNYVDSFYNIFKLRRERKVDWSFINKITENKSFLLTLINEIEIDFEKNKKNLDTLQKELWIEINSIALLKVYLKLNKNSYFLKNSTSAINDLILNHENLIKEKNIEISILNSFKKTLRIQKDDINKNGKIQDKNIILQEEAKNWSKEIAKQIAKNYVFFKKINSGNLKINLSGRKKTIYNIEFILENNIAFDNANNEVIDLLSHMIYSTQKDKSDWVNWLLQSYTVDGCPIKKKNHQEVIDLVQEFIVKKAIEKTIDDADGNDYNKMSLGTRTSYGIKQKIKNNKREFLFIDQPEDNLDNYTIYKELVPLIRTDLNERQIFLVTHNSNFGILTNPSKITSCNLNEQDFRESYKQTNDLHEKINLEEQLNDSPISHYLEGSMNSFDERYKKLH